MALYAVPRAGAILVHGNTRHTAAELVDLLAASGASAVLATADHLARITPHRDELPGVRHWMDLDQIDDTAGDSDGQSGTEPPGRAGDERDTAWLIYTSGTTGRPKGAMLTHRSIEAAVLNTTMARPVADDDVYLFPFPLFHVAAYNVIHHHLRRRPVVILPRFDPVAVMATIDRERVTSISLAPTMIAMILDHPDRSGYDLGSLRQIGYGASAMPLDLLHRTLAELPTVGLAQGYGMTELSGNGVFLGPEEHRRAGTVEPALLAAAGRPAPLIALRIADDDGHEVGRGEVGEILVRGDQVCAGYWDDPTETASAWTVDGWFRTGDVGRIDDDGFLYVVDRKKDIIITGGENVSSREVEDVVGRHDDVAAVAVVGIPDERWGERICAVVVARGGTAVDPDELIAWTDGRLAGFKRPRVVLTVDELPMNASGKIEKRVLRDIARDAFA